MRAEHPFLKACRREATDYTPIWLMRQAGRYMPEYRAIRTKLGFLELAKDPAAAAEVTVTAAERLGVDAAIIFSDILLVVEPMGVGLEFSKGDGPVIGRPVRRPADVDRLVEVDPGESVAFVFEAIRKARAMLAGRVPLIGFAGAPFTIASYLVEGGGSRDFSLTRSFMREEPAAWHALLGLLARTITRYLNYQIAAGADAVQLFDSWVGCLTSDEYREFVLPHSRATIQGIAPGVPVIHFGTRTGQLLELMREAGGDVIGVDWRVNLAEAWRRLGNVAVQGNLDPQALLSKPSEFRSEVQAILDQAAGRPGHIFNLGHGVLPDTPVEHVIALVEMVHEMSRKKPSAFSDQPERGSG